MAKTTIYEKDVTTTPAKSVTTNAVYVPGYAITGPLDTPTMCNSYEEFVNTFGSVPYILKENQSYDGHNIYAGDPEKSYLYAKELLFAGLPVLYERIATTQLSKTYAGTSIPVNAIKYWYIVPVSTEDGDTTDEQTTVSGQTIKLTETYSGTSPYYYTYTFQDTYYDKIFNTDNIYSAKLGTFSAEVSQVNRENPNQHISINYTITQNTNGEFEVTRVGETEDLGTVDISAELINGRLTITTKAVDVEEEGIRLDTYLTNISFTLNSPTNWVIEGTQDKWVLYAQKSRDVSIQQEVITSKDGKAFLTVNEEYSTFDCITPTGLRNGGISFSECNKNKLSTTYAIKFKAKYTGAYSAGLYIYIVKSSTTNYYTLSVFTSDGTALEQKTISFDSTNEKYFKNIQFNYIDFVSDTTPEDFYTTNYFYGQFSYAYLTMEDGYIDNWEEMSEDTSLETGEEFYLEIFYNRLGSKVLPNFSSGLITRLVDRNSYPIKYISTGAYPNYLRYNGNYLPYEYMIETAGNRTDAIALIDPQYDLNEMTVELFLENVNETLGESNSIITQLGEDAKKYAQMTIGAGKYNLRTWEDTITLPGSFAYLRCLAESSKTNPNYYAIAGVTRGLVPNFIEPVVNITGAEAELCQARTGVSINPITKINPYGYTIWGNRTLYPNVDDLVASSFLNIRVLCADIKKEIYKITQGLSFELYTDILWVNFKSALQKVLDKIKTNGGIRSYNIKQVSTNSRATIKALITISPVEAVEDFDITLELADGYVNIE